MQVKTNDGSTQVRRLRTVEITLFDSNKVAFMSFREQTGLIVENTSIYRTLKSIFEQQWESVG